VKRIAFAFVMVAVGAAAPSAAVATPPHPPPGCAVVVNTPAAVTGSEQGLAHKEATFERLCVAR
jgi:hypothetical protein